MVTEAGAKLQEGNKERRRNLDQTRQEIEEVKRDIAQLRKLKTESATTVQEVKKVMDQQRLESQRELALARERESQEQRAADDEGANIHKRLQNVLQNAEKNIRKVEEVSNLRSI